MPFPWIPAAGAADSVPETGWKHPVRIPAHRRLPETD